MRPWTGERVLDIYRMRVESLEQTPLHIDGPLSRLTLIDTPLADICYGLFCMPVEAGRC